MEESDFSATAYDRVYAAELPSSFSILGRQSCRHRRAWSESAATPAGVSPEPELALVLNREANLAGYYHRHDMSSRDIEARIYCTCHSQDHDRSARSVRGFKSCSENTAPRNGKSGLRSAGQESVFTGGGPASAK